MVNISEIRAGDIVVEIDVAVGGNWKNVKDNFTKICTDLWRRQIIKTFMVTIREAKEGEILGPKQE